MIPRGVFIFKRKETLLQYLFMNKNCIPKRYILL